MASVGKLLNIAIVGAGSIGCYLGGCLLSAGYNVTLIGRPRIQEQINTHGLTLTDWRERNEHIATENINFSLALSDIQNADYILVTVKSGNTEEVAQAIAQYAKPKAVVVSFQNGIRNANILKQFLSQHQVLKGMVPFNVLSKGKAHFHCGTEGDLAIADKDNVAEPLIHAFRKSELPVDIYNDLSQLQWSKLLMNLNNSINALSGLPLREQLHDRHYRKILALTIKEALQVLKHAGIKPVKNGKVIPSLLPFILSMPDFLYKIVAGSMLKIDPDARSSMYEDLALGRPTEIDFINGEVVSLAEQCGVKSPINTAITLRVKEAESAQKGSPNISANALYSLIMINA